MFGNTLKGTISGIWIAGTTARTGRLHVRRFQEERDRACLLVVDFRSSMFWGLKRAFLSVAAAETMALLGWQTVQEGGRVGLLAITTDEPVIVPIRGKTRGMVDVIGGLVRAHQRSLEDLVDGSSVREATLQDALSQARRLTPSGAEIPIASGFDDAGSDLEDQLNQLAHRRKPRLYLVSETRTHEMPRGRYPIKMANGQYKRLFLSRQSATDPIGNRQIAGRPAIVVNASDPVESIAHQILGATEKRASG